MNAAAPELSLIVPTRGRPHLLAQLLKSLEATTKRPERIEVVLVADDDAIPQVTSSISTSIVVGSPGRTMGELNRAGYAASRGNNVMLLNDDVLVQTRHWDGIVLKCFRRFPDPIALVHVNDTLIRDYLCTFPILPRHYVDLIGGICPAGYERYRIDDHIEDPFNMLAHVGIRRSVYLPDVVFEHRNSVNHPTAGAVYQSDPEILARDAARFDAMLSKRKEAALKLLHHIDGWRDPEKTAKIEAIEDSFALRTPGRQHVARAPWIRRAPREMIACGARLKKCYERAGTRGLVRAAVKRLTHRQ